MSRATSPERDPAIIRRALDLITNQIGVPAVILRQVVGTEGKPVAPSSYKRWADGTMGMGGERWWKLTEWLESRYGVSASDLIANNAEERIQRKLDMRKQRGDQDGHLQLPSVTANPTIGRVKIRRTHPTGDDKESRLDSHEVIDLDKLDDKTHTIPGKLDEFLRDSDTLSRYNITQNEAQMLIDLQLPGWMCRREVLVEIIHAWRINHRNNSSSQREADGN
ncbi:hypothetical protein KQI63_15635 [bacterium]|nr:hypothetical protein [bacterium]